MNPNVLTNGSVLARIAAFEKMETVPELKKCNFFRSSGQVSRIVSLFETKKTAEREVNQSSLPASTKVVKLAAIFEPVVSLIDSKRVERDGCDVRNEDSNTQFSMVTSKSVLAMLPKFEAECDIDDGRTAIGYVETLDTEKSTSNLLNERKTLQDEKSRTQEFGEKETADDRSSTDVVSRNADSMRFLHPRSKNRSFATTSAKTPTAPSVNGACKPVKTSRGLREQESVDEIKPNTNVPSKKRHGLTDQGKHLQVKKDVENTTSTPSCETTRRGLSNTGNKKENRRPGNERSSSVRKMLKKGLRALKHKLFRRSSRTETRGTSQGVTNDTTYMIILESASPINVSHKGQN